MLEGKGAKWSSVLDGATVSTDGEGLFDGNNTDPLMDYPLYAKANADGHWTKKAGLIYHFRVMGKDIPFTYTPTGTNPGRFDCVHGTANTVQKYCKSLTE